MARGSGQNTMETKALTVADLVEMVDQDAWYATEAKHQRKIEQAQDAKGGAPRMTRLERNYSKYFDLPKWLKYHLRNAQQIRADTAEAPQRILDVGCGSGLFLFVCKCFGHDVTGIDVDSPMYADMARVLGVPVVPTYVRPMEPLDGPFEGYDWITAIAIKFDREDFGSNRREPWRLEEWQFFLRDLAGRLNPGGHIYIKPNLLANEAPFDDPAVIAFLHETASEVLEPLAFIIPKDRLA
ncbi:MAG: methyltransferase domain-containing protein [Paracoccaceae bacterium]